MKTAIRESALDWMPKSVWGPIKWKELHTRALTSLPMESENEWFREYLRGLPCPECRAHFEDFLKESPPDFSSRDRFFRWTVAAHNFVNRACGQREWSVEEARKEHSWT
jgi:hypothetical protein